MVVYSDPFLILVCEFAAEVCEEVHFLLGAVDEVVLASDDCEFAFCAYGLCLVQFFFVGFFFDGESRFVDEVDAEVFVPDVFPCVRMSERRIVVEVEGDFPAVEQPLA